MGLIRGRRMRLSAAPDRTTAGGAHDPLGQAHQCGHALRWGLIDALEDRRHPEEGG